MPVGNTINFKVDINFNTDRHGYTTTISIQLVIEPNSKTPKEIAAMACAAIKDKLADALAEKGLPRADADKFLRVHGNTVVIKGTPPNGPTGNNSGTPEKPNKSYTGNLDQKPQVESWTQKG